MFCGGALAAPFPLDDLSSTASVAPHGKRSQPAANMGPHNDSHDRPRPDAARLARNIVLVVAFTLCGIGYLIIRLLEWFASGE